jgi:hypothetical protein
MKYPCLLTKKINEISSAKYNPRKITDEAMGRLTKSLAEFGNIQPITWNVRTGNVVGGHQRLKVYKAMGKTEVDVWAVDLDEQKEKAANIALNKLSGEFDMPMLKDILEEIDTGDLDMEITGFGMDEIALMMEDAHPEITEDEVPEVPVDAITKPGDLWLLGEHRVLCGDSTSEADVSRLMNGEKADMVFTDPPYGIGYSSQRWANLAPQSQGLSVKRNYAPMIIGDEKPFDPSFLLSIFSKAREVFIWGFQYYPEKLGRGGIIVWNKKKESQSECAHGDFELCWSKNERNKMCWLTWGGFKSKEKGEDRLHTTQKPIALAVWFFEQWGEKDDIITDCFLGSGTTLIAAEQLGRKCYGMEISPNYCDVIVKRWENLTNKKATLAK